MLAEEARRPRKWIGEDLRFQSGPGKAINCLQPLLDGGNLGGKVVKLLAAALTGQGGGSGQRQAVQLVGVDQLGDPRTEFTTHIQAEPALFVGQSPAATSKWGNHLGKGLGEGDARTGDVVAMKRRTWR